MDLILAIKHERKNMQHSSKLKWIRGHPDKNTPKNKLTQEQVINVETDQVSKCERITGTKIHETPYTGSGAVFIIDNKWVTTEYKEQIRSAIMKPEHKKFFLHKFRRYNITENEYDNIA